jgi:N-sulfoglucosamine sulfohydrolase
MKRAFALLLLFVVFIACNTVQGAESKDTKITNILLITADDLNADSLGCYGCPVSDITPNLDSFAKGALRFDKAHVTVAICQPSRGVLHTGLYPHHSGIMGFMNTKKEIPTVMETLGEAGYLTGILGKVSHSTPKAAYKWDFHYDQNRLGNGRSPQKYYDYCKEFFEKCKKEKKPFYFMVNSHDPHRPFHVTKQKLRGGMENPTRQYDPKEAEIPGFLPDLKGVRQEMSYYFNSVRRLDDTFGRIMKALDESGFADSTAVFFLSDNGIAVPFAKCNAYLAATRTPLMVRLPGGIKGRVDKEHFVSGIDFFPTVLDMLNMKAIKSLDGDSFLPLLKGQKQSNREKVFTQIDSKAGNAAVPMRCVQDKNFGYIFNAWAKGDHYYRNNNEGMSMKAMNEAAKTNPAIAARVKLFRYRAPQEFFDLKNDPDCLHNLIDNPKYKKQLIQKQRELEAWMLKTKDPLLTSFRKREDVQAMFKAASEVPAYKKLSEATGSKQKKKKKN